MSEAFTFAADRMRRYRNTARAMLWWGVAGWAVTLLLAYALICTVPLIRVVPVFVTMRGDGSMDTKVMFSSLPTDTRVAGVQAALWQYVRQREGYSYHDRPYDYDVVSHMSASAIRASYQQWANSKDASNPAVKLLDKGFINVSIIDGAFVAHSADYSSGTYRITFRRLIVEEAVKEPLEQDFVVSVSYALTEALPVIERITFNPSGIVVTEYPEPEPVAPAHRVRGGA